MRTRLTLSSAVAAALVVAACGAPERTASVPEPTTSAPAAAASATANCRPPATTSYPATSLTAKDGPTLSRVLTNKKLVVGISADSRLLGSRNLITGKFQGIDIEMANRVAKAIFGDGWQDHLVFKTINAAQRVPLLENGQIDMVARAMTMNCDRWNQVAFSEPYFEAAQGVLVRRNATETTLATLATAKKRVCATNGSTSIQRLREQFGGAQVVGVPLTTDCLVLWQQGAVDAITGDDAILAGLAQQDPAAQVGKQTVGKEPYGLAVKKGDKQFVGFLNALLEQMRRSGDWQKAYRDSGLLDGLGAREQPVADLSRS